MVPLLLSLAAKGTVVLAIGASATVLFRRSSASLRHGIWAATFVALLAVPMLGVLGPSWHVAVLPSEASALAQAPPALSPTPLAGPSADRPGGLSSPVPTASRSAVLVATWLGGLWALGVLAVSLLWLRGFLLGRRLVRTSPVMDDGAWPTRVRAAARAIGLRPSVRLRRSEALGVPVAWGWGHPTVVLPPQSDAWDAERAHSVLLHEMAHLRRRDAWTQGVAQAALALHWPNPLAWIAYRRFLNAREQACDDAVLQVVTRPTTYASHLVAVARELRPSRLMLASVAPMIGPDELETRVRSILDDRRRRAPASRWALGVTLTLAVLTGGPLAAFQPVPAATARMEENDAVRWTARPASADTLDVPTLPARDPQPAEETRQQPERSAQRSERKARLPAHEVRRDTTVAERNAATEMRNDETEARNAATKMRNAESDARNAATEMRNAETEARNAATEMRNAESEARNAPGWSRPPALPPHPASTPPSPPRPPAPPQNPASQP